MSSGHVQDDLVALYRVVLHPIDFGRSSVDIAGKQSFAVDLDIADATPRALLELIEAAARAGQFTTTQAALTRLQTLGNGAHSDRGLGLVALATALISAGPVAAEEFER